MLTEPQCLHWIERHSEMASYNTKQLAFYVRELKHVPEWETKAEAAMTDASQNLTQAIEHLLKAMLDFRSKRVADKLEAAE
jgi:hypothetical protein